MSVISFRVKCRTATKFICDTEESIAVQSFANPLRVKPVKEVFGQNFIDIRSDNYASQGDAQKEADRLAELLLLAGAKRGFGARLEGGRLSFGEEVTRNFKETTGKDLVPDRTGITIYEPPIEIYGFFAQGSVSEPAVQIAESLAEVAHCQLPLLERQRIALILLNDTYFEATTDTILILSITATEALCPELQPTKFFQSIVSVLISLVSLSEAVFGKIWSAEKSADVEELRKKLEALQKRGSVRQGYLKKIRALLDNSTAREFDKLYNDRSKFVHEGLGRGSYDTKAYRAREIAMRLLFAELAGSPNVAAAC